MYIDIFDLFNDTWSKPKFKLETLQNKAIEIANLSGNHE